MVIDGSVIVAAGGTVIIDGFDAGVDSLNATGRIDLRAGALLVLSGDSLDLSSLDMAVVATAAGGTSVPCGDSAIMVNSTSVVDELWVWASDDGISVLLSSHGPYMCQSASGNSSYVPPENTCMDGSMDGEETDVDCGGIECPACGQGKQCIDSGDCEGDLVCGEGASNSEYGSCTVPGSNPDPSSSPVPQQITSPTPSPSSG